jgi:predicted ribosomally synthesized peptide with SipW-like signal peptide
MTKMRAFISIMIIILALALVGGATAAWFTAQASIQENEFVAGTVSIDAERGTAHASKIIEDNWNPGDTTDLEICIENEGTKAINLRAKLTGHWIPSSWRLLIVHTGNTIQLLVVDWDSTKGCTGTSGPIATGSFTIINPVPNPTTQSYFNGQFTQLSNENWLTNGSGYSVWCVDSINTINPGTTYNNVKIFDPFCNEDWYTEIDLEEGQNELWKAIPWTKIAYIIDQSPSYLESGYAIMDIQQAIWFFTNGSFASGQGGNETKAQQIVADTEENYKLSIDNVSFSMDNLTDWQEVTDGDETWYYYKGIIPGTLVTPTTICFTLPVYLDPLLTGNQYQGAQFWLGFAFEAIQASNQASDDVWQMSWNGTTWTPVGD